MLKYDFVQVGPYTYEIVEKGTSVPVNVSDLIFKAFADGKMAKK